MNAKMMRKLKPLIVENRTAFAIVQHLSTAIGVLYGDPLVLAGGQEIRYAADLIVDLRKKSIAADDPIKKEEGIKIGASITKNHVKTGRFPYLKTTYYGLFGQGTESYLEIIDLALKKGVINKSGAFYKIIDDSGEPVILEDGTKLQWQGTARLRNYLIENPEFYSKLVTQLGGNTDIESMSEKEIEIAKEQEEKEKETHVKSLTTSNKKSSKKKKKEEEENKIVQEEEDTNA